MLVRTRKPGEFRLGFGLHLTLWLALAILVAGAGYFGLSWLVKPVSTQDRFDMVKIALTVAAGIGGVVALVVAFRRQHLSEAEHVRQEDAAKRERTKLFNERFGKAAELLSADKPASRLAGVYAMAGLADDWVEGQQRCIDVLCAYLRMPYTKPNDDSPPEAWEQRIVRHTIIRVIAAHLQADAEPSWHGRDFDFTRVVFDGGNMTGAVFAAPGRVSFQKAQFMSHFGFNYTVFDTSYASFNGASVHHGRLSFIHAKLGGHLEMMRLRVLDGAVDFLETNFDGHVHFDGATLIGGNVRFGACRFEGSWSRSTTPSSAAPT
ncbi:pentapeptide repeat-containing protein [Kibdelosporangium lantanae]